MFLREQSENRNDQPCQGKVGRRAFLNVHEPELKAATAEPRNGTAGIEKLRLQPAFLIQRGNVLADDLKDLPLIRLRG
jgi:hypothetical protein